jgi:cytochrome c
MPPRKWSIKRRPGLAIRVANVAIAGAMAATFAGGAARAGGDATRGETLYQGCEDCHSIERNDVGPRHKGIVGRTAGSLSDYSYSPALKNSKIVWTEANLDKWLANPQQFVPGSRMFYKVDNPRDRADLIEFLKERAR